MTQATGRAILVTGATGGMGQAIARSLSKQGFRLALAGRDESRAAALAGDCGAAWSGALDVTAEESVERQVRQAAAALGGLDAVINLPGLSKPGKVEAMPLADAAAVLDVNVKGAFLVCKHFLQQVDAQRGGQILLVGSMAAKRANANAPLYCTAKAALNMFAQGLSLQAREKGVRVTMMNPGPTDTTGFWGDRPVPREKFMQPGDVADVAAFVLSLPARVVLHEISFEPFAFYRDMK